MNQDQFSTILKLIKCALAKMQNGTVTLQVLRRLNNCLQPFTLDVTAPDIRYWTSVQRKQQHVKICIKTWMNPPHVIPDVCVLKDMWKTLMETVSWQRNVPVTMGEGAIMIMKL